MYTDLFETIINHRFEQKIWLCSILILKKIISNHIKPIGTESKTFIYGHILLLFPRIDSLLLLDNLSECLYKLVIYQNYQP